jgi:heat-inducible transcriptional repressor
MADDRAHDRAYGRKGPAGDDSKRQAKRRQDMSRPEPSEELDSRKSAILNAVVNEHVETAQPVGSQHVSVGVGVSSATVRSEMSALEREGFLLQPHTSAGRIPTDRGYRYFVDHLTLPGVLGPVQHKQVRALYAHVHGEVEELLERTSQLLAGLTDHVSVVFGRSHEAAAVRSVQLVGISPHVAVLVAVLSDGAVEKRTIEFEDDVSPEVLADASAHLGSHLVGSSLAPQDAVPSSGDPAVDEVTDLTLGAIGELATHERDHVFVGGSSSMASAFDAVETVRSVLSILEQQLVVVELIEDVLDRGLSVAIGSEHGFEPLASCALVVAPVQMNGEELGTIGVLGPTRMNYPKALAAVRLVGEELAERLGRHREDVEGGSRDS